MSKTRVGKREKILEAAGELFGIHGFQATSMESIAKFANVSKQTVYSHFQNKDTLFAACMKTNIMEYQADKFAFGPDSPIEKVLLGFAHGFQKHVLRPGPLQTYRNVVSTSETHPEFAEAYFKFGPDRTINILADYLDKKVEDGTIELEISSYDTAIQLLLMFHGKAVYFGYLGIDFKETEEERDQYLKSCVDMFLSHALISR